MKDSTVSARVENDVKNEAEDILQKLGVPVSVVINSLYRQIIYHHGIPFSLTVPSEPRTLDAMSDAEFDAKLQHSYAQSAAGEGRPLGENPATELEDINQEIAELQKDILAGVKAHWDVTELAERVQELRSRKTEIEAGRTAEKRNKERIDNHRESIDFKAT
ncbi:MAG: type II toxin-antitoxin system RelB/DinJ family antitoxin [Clostridiales bacterium]|nr:type II toxin-antitoxin system RelB/DinJ family antitoxin [Clostridiales bacterium]